MELLTTTRRDYSLGLPLSIIIHHWIQGTPLAFASRPAIVFVAPPFSLSCRIGSWIRDESFLFASESFRCFL